MSPPRFATRHGSRRGTSSCCRRSRRGHREGDMSNGFEIRRLEKLGQPEIDGLSDVLIDCVEGGASVNFMYPMSRAKAESFWQSAAGSVARGERLVLAAFETSGTIIGTVQLIWAGPENQPHRADLAKMLVHGRARRHGVG